MILLVAVCGSVRQDNVDIHSPITIHTTVISVAWNSLIFTLNPFLLWDQVITGFFIFVTILNIAFLSFKVLIVVVCRWRLCALVGKYLSRSGGWCSSGHRLAGDSLFFLGFFIIVDFFFYSFKRLSPIQFLPCASRALLRRGISQPWNCTQVGIPGIFKCGMLLARRSSRWL